MVLMDSPIEEIKNRLDIVEVISQYVKLQKAGANYKAPCPFHSEKTGSFFVSPSRQIWHCFGCQKGGNMFSFVKDIEGVEFGDALRILANKAGVELKKQTREMVQMKTARQRSYDLVEAAARFFEKQLEGSAVGRAVKQYLLGRGLSGESIEEWRIGYSPDTWHGLSTFLTGLGFSDSEILAAGMTIRGESGSVYDRFRGRIMFPIFDFNSQVVGFGGRVFHGASKQEAASPDISSAKAEALAKAEAKYINISNTILYDKSRILYGLDRAKAAIRKQNAVILVEGYTDVIMSVQAAAANVVSSSGTALTLQQLKILKRFTDNLILGYDMDLAGDTANKRGIELAQAEGFNVKVVRPPYEGKDPADVIAQDPAEWIKALEHPKSIMEFYFDNAFAARDPKTAEGKREIGKILLPQIKRVSNAIERSHWLQKLSRDLGVREEDLREELKRVKLEQYVPSSLPPAPVFSAKPRHQLVEERLLILAIKYPAVADLIEDSQIDRMMPETKEIISWIKTGGSMDNPISGAAAKCHELLCLRADIETIAEPEAANEVAFHVRAINKQRLKSQLEEVSARMAAAEASGDAEKLRQLCQEFNSLSKSIKMLETARENGSK